MYCPMGFKTLIDLCDFCSEVLQSDRSFNTVLERASIEFSETSLSPAFERWDSILVLWLLDQHIWRLRDKLWVCSPSGELFKISNYAVLKGRPDIGFDPRTSDQAAWESYFENFATQYVFLEPLFSIIQRTPLDKEPNLKNSPGVAGIWKALSHFDGWSVCVSEQDFPTHSESAEQETDLDKKLMGRPRKQEYALEVYRLLYPNGHKASGHTWQQAANEVSKYAGDERFSIDTVKRALGLKE